MPSIDLHSINWGWARTGSIAFRTMDRRALFKCLSIHKKGSSLLDRDRACKYFKPLQMTVHWAQIVSLGRIPIGNTWKFNTWGFYLSFMSPCETNTETGICSCLQVAREGVYFLTIEAVKPKIEAHWTDTLGSLPGLDWHITEFTHNHQPPWTARELILRLRVRAHSWHPDKAHSRG